MHPTLTSDRARRHHRAPSPTTMRIASSMSTRSTPSPPSSQIPLPPYPSSPSRNSPISTQTRRYSHHHSSGPRVHHPDRERVPSPKPSSASNDNSSGSSGGRRRDSTPSGRMNGRKSTKEATGGAQGIGAREGLNPQPTFVDESSSAPGGESASSTEGEQQSRWSKRNGLPINTFLPSSTSTSLNPPSTTTALSAPSTPTSRSNSHNTSILIPNELGQTSSLPRSRPHSSGHQHHTHHRATSPPSGTLLPLELHLSFLGNFSISRTFLESTLVVAAVLGGALALHQQGSLADHRGAFETIFITTISLAYFLLRSASLSPSRSRQSSPKNTPAVLQTLPAQPRLAQTSSHPSRPSRASPTSSFSFSLFRDGSKGFVWGTDDRDYRDEPDDGALIALLFGPLAAIALLLTTLRQLVSPSISSSALPLGWLVEEPLVIPSTISESNASISLNASAGVESTRIALEALAKSRRSMLSLSSVLAVVLLLQLLFSRWAEALHARKKRASTLGDREGSTGNAGPAGEKWWLPRSEWKRTGSVVSFALAVSAGISCVKAALQHFEMPIWTNLTIIDIFIASLFHQSSMYVCVRLARRGFTLGELGIVAQFSTALFMETVNLTRAKNSISFLSFLSTSYVQTYRLPTPLLIFQLALIPGSFLTGILLSPLLVLSRHISQKPARRLRFPEEKLLHRRYLALSFYVGTIVIVGGGVGMWTKWQLGWRDPWMWVIWWMADGTRWWSRLSLLGYWGVLAVISVGGWQLQLAKARKGRAWISVGSDRNVIAVSSSPANTPAITPTTGRHEIPTPKANYSSLGLDATRTVAARSSASPSASATDGAIASGESSSPATRHYSPGRMMRKVPILSLNGRRKFFHGLAVLMFIPGIYIDPSFTHLAFSVAFAFFIFAEYVRYFALYPFGAIVHLFLNEFLDHKDSGTAILSHFYLLTGCALGLWLESPAQILSYIGVLTLGIGDALASIVGRRFGKTRWSTSSGKTVEGTVAFFVGVFVPAVGLRMFGVTDELSYFKFAFTIALSALLEAWSNQNDNLIIPLYTWSVASLLGC